MRFGYAKSLIKPAPGFEAGLIYQPKIAVVLVGPIGQIRFNALVDTGSDQTILPAFEIEKITGIRINRSEVAEVRGRLEDHREELYLGENCMLRLSDEDEQIEFSSSIWFSDDNDSPAILGHSGFLEFFSITFDGLHREVVIIPHEKFSGTIKKLNW